MRCWMRHTALAIVVTFLSLAPSLAVGEPQRDARAVTPSDVAVQKGSPATITVTANQVRTVATSFAEWHAAALRSGCDALASGRAQQTLATMTRQLQFVTGSTGPLGSSLLQLRTFLDQSGDKTRPDPAACAGFEASLRRTISRAEALAR